MSLRKSFVAILSAGLLLLGAQAAVGQASYPGLQGGNQRDGRNSDPANYNSGRTILQWFVGNNTADPFGTIVVDDDFPGTSTTTPGVTYSTTGATRIIGTAQPTSGTWSLANTAQAANNYYQPVGAPGPYHYSTCVPSAVGGDPTLAATGTANQWTWTAPSAAFGYTESYALYVWLPIGQTQLSTGTYLPAQRYFVYKIAFANGQTYTDVVDTYASGYGWVRLGGGGFPTNAVFGYDGKHPVSVTLYNTIPRDANGNLLSGTTATASKYLVYADAFKAVPNQGYFTASPTSDYLRNTAGNPLVDSAGDIDVAPQLNGAHTARITVALNQLVGAFIGTTYETNAAGKVTSYVMDPHTWPQAPTLGAANGVPYAAWTWQPAVQSLFNATLINGVQTTGWTVGTVNTSQGTGYFTSPIASTPANEQTVTYAPTALATGEYSIYAYLPGDKSPETYGTEVTYNILVGGTIVATGTVNESIGGGWVQLGTEQWPNEFGTNPGALSVQLTNLSTKSADVGKLAYASGVKFVAPSITYAVNSSPVHAQVKILKANGTTAVTQVVVVADENGRIHCLDEVGNGDGTTTEYWSYPSTPDPTNATWVDPNLSSGIDGPAGSTIPSALMPTSFSLSTAVIKPASTTDTHDRLYIMSTNGRVYCIDMLGRGDYSVATSHPGSTQRLWSYPNDYPATQVQSTLGSTTASLVYGDASTTASLTNPTIFVPTGQGRIYSLDALGNITKRTTTVNWTFPLLKTPPLPSIQMTPNLAFGRLYFGTPTDPNDNSAGAVHALNAATGVQLWYFNGLANGATLGSNIVTEAVGDFIAGPASASAAMLTEAAPPYTVTPSDSIYFINSNQSVYGFNAETGALLTDSTGQGYVYDDSELGVVSTQNLGINYIYTYDRTSAGGGGPRSIPVVMIPDSSGQVYALFANVDDYNLFSYSSANTLYGGTSYLSLEAFGYGVFGTNLTSLAFSNSRMIGADDSGYMYVWDNDSANYGLDNAGTPPSGGIIPPNVPNPYADAFRYLHLKPISKAGFTALSSVNANNQGTADYAGAVGSATTGKGGAYDVVIPTGQTSFAFEWGETAYILVYDFPYQPANALNAVSNGEQVNIRLSQNGKVIRNYSVSASQFKNNTTAPTTDGRRHIGLNVALPTTPTQWYDDGYAVIPITFQGGGANALPPGPGIVTADVTTSALSSGNNTSFQEIASDPSPFFARVPYLINNPIAFAVQDAFTGSASSLNPIIHSYAERNGETARYDGTVNNNGNSFGGTLSDTYPAQYLQSLGFALDGQSQSVTVYLYDRSLMCLLHPDGLSNVRMDSSDLAWQGGASTIYNPMPQSLYPNFEDPPVNFPNNSLDYPNISHDRVQFTASSGGVTSNPALPLGMTLNPPTDLSGNPITPNTANVDNRLLVQTPVQITLNVPLFQPAVNMSALVGSSPQDLPDVLGLRHDSVGNGSEPQGMWGNIHAFVDTSQEGFSDQDAFRLFHLTSGIEPDRKLVSGVSNVELGSLPEGAGYSPLNPYLSSAPYSPWTGAWAKAYHPFTVGNWSNVNLPNIRIAKASDVGLNKVYPWVFTASGNDANAVLDGSLDLWSNLDAIYATPNPFNGDSTQVFSQKPRPSDGVGSQIVLNPVPRLNPNLNEGLQGSQLNTNYPTNVTPKISVSVPFGFPAGEYSSSIHVIDDTPISIGSSSFNGLGQVWESGINGTAIEPSADPFILSLTSRETRITNSESPYTAPFGPNYIDRYEANHSLAPAYTPTYSSPAALRDSFGSVILAYSSNDFQSEFTQFQNSAPSTNGDQQLYVYSVANAATFTGNGINVPNTLTYTNLPGPTTPLKDFSFFENPTSGASSWLTNQTPGGYPKSSIIPVAPIDNNGTIISATESYDSPSFPISGSKDPISGSDLGFEYMAFLGRAQRSTATGRVAETHVFLTQVKSGAKGQVTMDAAGAPVNTSFPTGQATQPGEDPLTGKGRPTVAQTSSGALVLYPVTEGNNSSIHFSRYSAGSRTFGGAVAMDFGTGFSSVSDPKATIRKYEGISPNYTPNLLDLTFTGKLRGRPTPDVFLAQMRLSSAPGDWQIVDANGKSIEQAGSFTPFAYFAPQVNELLQSQGGGKFFSSGVEWDRTQPVYLYQYVGGVATDLLIETTRNSDRETGIVSYDTRLGGKVYIDPEVGSVTFSQGVPASSSEIRMTYTPGFLRIDPVGTEAVSNPIFIYENNYTSDLTEWYTASGQAETGTPQDARFVFMYGTVGKNQNGNVTARPFMQTERLGVNLPYRIAVNADGSPYKGLTVKGNKGPYQLDPADGRIYFTGVDEDNTISVTFTPVNEATNSPFGSPVTYTIGISLITEQSEHPIAIDGAVNEGDMWAFLDPFTYNGGQRPALFWMFYTSTRAGSPDIYMQTIAPRFAPFIK